MDQLYERSTYLWRSDDAHGSCGRRSELRERAYGSDAFERSLLLQSHPRSLSSPLCNFNRLSRTGCTGVTGISRCRYHFNTCIYAPQSTRIRWTFTALGRTFVPYLLWSFDAPTTAYAGADRKSFWISATTGMAVPSIVDEITHAYTIFTYYRESCRRITPSCMQSVIKSCSMDYTRLRMCHQYLRARHAGQPHRSSNVWTSPINGS